MIAAQAIMCRVCFTMLHDNNLCACGNVGLLLDIDGHMHIYVNDIHTTQRALVFLDGTQEVSRELLEPFVKALFAPYTIAKSPLNFVTKPLGKTHQRATQYDTSLMKAMNRHKYTTSDGTERFRPSALEKDIL